MEDTSFKSGMSSTFTILNASVCTEIITNGDWQNSIKWLR